MTNRNDIFQSLIDRDLGIFKIKKVITYQKLISGVKKTKEKIVLLTCSLVIPYCPIVSTTIIIVINKIIPAAKTCFKNRKRGGQASFSV